MKIYNFINKKYPNHKIFAILLILLFLGYVGYVQIVSADNLTKSRVASYAEIKQAGLWLKQNTLPSEIIATQSIHHIVYYADREIQLFPETAEEFDELLKKNQEINYFMVSIVQNSPPWTYTYPQENNFTPVEAYFADIQQTQPLLVIYRID